MPNPEGTNQHTVVLKSQKGDALIHRGGQKGIPVDDCVTYQGTDKGGNHVITASNGNHYGGVNLLNFSKVKI